MTRKTQPYLHDRVDGQHKIALTIMEWQPGTDVWGGGNMERCAYVGHILLLVVAIGFAVLAGVSGTAAVRERILAGPTPTGQPPPAAGTPRDRLNKWGVTAAVAAVLCAVAFLALAIGR